jgi:hypothetical protein
MSACVKSIRQETKEQIRWSTLLKDVVRRMLYKQYLTARSTTYVALYPLKNIIRYIAHLRQQCHNPKFVIFQEKRLNVLKCYHFL